MRVPALPTTVVLLLVIACAPARGDMLGNLVNEIGERLLHGEEEQPAPPEPADIRGIPASAVEGLMQPPRGREVTINGKVLTLSPGLRIRDPMNRIVLPGYIRQPVPGKYVLDRFDQVHRVWIMAAR